MKIQMVIRSVDNETTLSDEISLEQGHMIGSTQHQPILIHIPIRIRAFCRPGFSTVEVVIQLKGDYGEGKYRT